MVKEKCMCIPFHFLEAPEILKVSQRADLGGGKKVESCFRSSKNESAGPGGAGGHNLLTNTAGGAQCVTSIQRCTKFCGQMT